jgi:hypothetical protein
LDQRINHARGPKQQQRRRGDGVANGVFPHIYQGLERAEAALTCRQGDPKIHQKKESGRKRQGQIDKRIAIHGMYTKTPEAGTSMCAGSFSCEAVATSGPRRCDFTTRLR